MTGDPGEWVLQRRLAEASGAVECLGYDACPGPGGLVYTIDGYAEEESRYWFMTLGDWGYRSVAAAVADLVAAGSRPLAVYYSVGTPDPHGALEVARGVGDAARELGVVVLKSDYNRGRVKWIDVAAVGAPARGRVVSRRGARPGDLVVQAGYTGYGALEALVAERVIPVDEAAVPGVPRRLPPRVWDVVSGYASSSIDNSDGLVASLYLLARESGVAVHVTGIHADERIREVLEGYLGTDAVENALLYSWEDYSIIFTVPADSAEEALEECSRVGVPCGVIGRISAGDPRVYYRGRRLEVRGWFWLNGSLGQG